MEHTIIAKVYSLVAEMEALKVEVEVLKKEYPEGGEHMLQEKADELRGVSQELQQLEDGKMSNFVKVLNGGNLTITEEMFQKVADCDDLQGMFTKEQIMESDLPDDLLLEIASGGWDDTCQRELIMDHLSLKYIGMSWPCYMDSKKIKDKFSKKVKQFGKGEKSE